MVLEEDKLEHESQIYHLSQATNFFKQASVSKSIKQNKKAFQKWLLWDDSCKAFCKCLTYSKCLKSSHYNYVIFIAKVMMVLLYHTSQSKCMQTQRCAFIFRIQVPKRVIANDCFELTLFSLTRENIVFSLNVLGQTNL